jgi:hypothetical protein
VSTVKGALLLLAGGTLAGAVGALYWLLYQVESEERRYRATYPWR